MQHGVALQLVNYVADLFEAIAQNELEHALHEFNYFTIGNSSQLKTGRFLGLNFLNNCLTF